MRSQLLSLVGALLLCACSTSLQGVGDAYRIVRATGAHSSHDTGGLDPTYSWLRFTLHGHSTVFALGYVDLDPNGAIEVWYGAGREVLRLQNGRVIDTAGLPVNWSSVRYSARPVWQSVNAPLTFTRTRDVMPGYEFGVVDTLTLAPIKPPSSSDLMGIAPAELAWFEETSRGSQPLPRARYAVATQGGKAVVVYGEQCLSKAFCLSWQRLPARAPEKSHAE
jgi:hypothetical protein